MLIVSAPSVPRRLRAFVTSHRGSDVTGQVRVDVRWARPAEPAGIISSYHVLMTTSLVGDDSWNVTTLAGEQLPTKFSLVNAPISTVLYFKVRIFLLFSSSVVYDRVQVKRALSCDLSQGHVTRFTPRPSCSGL